MDNEAARPPPLDRAEARVVIDTCVLFPPGLRAIVIDLAGQGALAPLWSPRILEEWRRAAARAGPVPGVEAEGQIALLRAAFPGALHPGGDEAALPPGLPDPADAHVLALAIAAGAGTILTANLRDFPARILAPHGVRAVSPDDFLMQLWIDGAPVEAAAHRAHALVATAKGDTPPLRGFLKRLGLRRLARALGGASG